MHDPLWHIVSSTNVAQPDFRFVMDVFFSGVPGIAARLKIHPDANGHGRFDAARVVRSQLKNYFAPRAAALGPFTIKTNDVIVSYTVAYGEEYGGTTYAGLTADGYYAYNAYSGDMPGVTVDEPISYNFHGWATSRNINDIRMPRNGTCYLPYINDTPENKKLKIEILSSGGLIGPTLTSGTITATGNRLLVLNLNPAFINASGAFAGTPIPSNADGYRIAVERASGSAQTPWAYVSFLCEPKDPATALHFLNRFGGFDTYHFTGPTRKAVEVERTTYQQLGQVTNFSYLREYTPWDGGNVFADTITQYNTRHTWTRKLTSGYIDDATHEWLWQLITSPQVYLEDNGYFYPVLIKTNNWGQRKTRYDKMYNLELEVIMGRQVFSQSR